MAQFLADVAASIAVYMAMVSPAGSKSRALLFALATFSGLGAIASIAYDASPHI